jgi:hypothetical protein
VPTLQAWYDRFNANWDRIRALPTSKPFDERFRRMWNYYLMSSKAAFDVELLHLWQLVMTRRNSGRGVYRRVLQRSAGRPQPTSRETAEPQALDAPSRRIRAAGPGRG